MKYIAITGAGFKNKGAEAMTLISVCELKKRFPDHRILLISDVKKDCFIENADDYYFEVIEAFPLKYALANKYLFQRLICYFKHRKEYKKCREIFCNTDIQIDISGYALGSNWKDYIVNSYLDKIEFAQLFGVPTFLMPQSFGPFDYSEDNPINKRIKKILPKIDYICAREEEGLNLLCNRYNLTNIVLKPDLVLSSTIDYRDAYIKYRESPLPIIPENSVAIILNDKVFDRFTEKDFFDFYDCIVHKLLSLNKQVYIISHSSHDIQISKKLKKDFNNEKYVHLISSECSCVDFNRIISCFDFCIASRFHSLVHAVKNGIPCIAVGWAIKYHDLMNSFGLNEYYFDINDGVDTEKVINAIDKMNKNSIQLSRTITLSLKSIQNNDVFNMVQSLIEKRKKHEY